MAVVAVAVAGKAMAVVAVVGKAMAARAVEMRLAGVTGELKGVEEIC